MIPLDLWNSDEMKKRRQNAVAKALKEKPKVEQIQVEGFAAPDGTVWTAAKVFKVKDTYTVVVVRDADSQFFNECDCQAGTPPIDEATGLPSREATICYHAASVLIHIAEEEKEKNV